MKIKYVDGLKIRNSLDVDFGVIGSNRLYSYIPKVEIWFDKHYFSEKEHFLKIHLEELKLMNKMSYEKARAIIEKKFIEKIDSDKIPNFIIKQVNHQGFRIQYVDGKIIRKYIDPKFIFGMHGVLERGYFEIVGKGNIWIDIRQDKREIKYTILHEITEANLMKKGMSYNDAHDFSLVTEKIERRKDGAVYLKD